MINPSLTRPPATDPTPVLRYRDGLYAVDLLAAAVSHLDLFSWLHAHQGACDEDLVAAFGFARRPLDVLLTLCRANEYLRTDSAGRHVLTPLAG